MKYIKRFVFVLVAIIVGILSFPILACDVIFFGLYFVVTGRFYVNDYNPLVVVICCWLLGSGWEWKKRNAKISEDIDVK